MTWKSVFLQYFETSVYLKLTYISKEENDKNCLCDCVLKTDELILYLKILFIFFILTCSTIFVSLIIGENDVEYSLAAQSVLFREREAVADQSTGHAG
jgi:hypothetical protein